MIITRDRPDQLLHCLESLVRQNYPTDCYEIVVIDDGSAAPVRPLVERYATKAAVRCVAIPPGGCAVARSEGVRQASHDVIAFVDDDHLVAPEWLASVDAFFAAYPDARAVRYLIENTQTTIPARMEQFYADTSFRLLTALRSGGRIGWSLLRGLLPHPFRRLTVAPSYFLPIAGGAACRRDVFEEVGLFRSDLVRGEDIEIGWRIGRRGIPIYLKADGPPLRHTRRFTFRTVLARFQEFGYWQAVIKAGDAAYPFFAVRSVAGALSMALYVTVYPVIKSLYAPSLWQFLLFSPTIVLAHACSAIGFYQGLRFVRRSASGGVRC